MIKKTKNLIIRPSITSLRMSGGGTAGRTRNLYNLLKILNQKDKKLIMNIFQTILNNIKGALDDGTVYCNKIDF